MDIRPELLSLLDVLRCNDTSSSSENLFNAKVIVFSGRNGCIFKVTLVLEELGDRGSLGANDIFICLTESAKFGSSVDRTFFISNGVAFEGIGQGSSDAFSTSTFERAGLIS